MKSDPMTKREILWKRLASKMFRDAFISEFLNSRLSIQIHAMRLQRGWTQKDLSERSGMAQPTLSKLETSCDNVSLTTLKRLAKAFDVALIVKFVPFREAVREMENGHLDRDIASFPDDSFKSSRFSISLQTSVGPATGVTLRASDMVALRVGTGSLKAHPIPEVQYARLN